MKNEEGIYRRKIGRNNEDWHDCGDNMRDEGKNIIEERIACVKPVKERKRGSLKEGRKQISGDNFKDEGKDKEESHGLKH